MIKMGELREKRNLAIENLNHAIAIFGSDELYIYELVKDSLEVHKRIFIILTINKKPTQRLLSGWVMKTNRFGLVS